jgi:hypothetical protein
MSSERGRIEFLLARDGLPATRQWVARTAAIYRAALGSPSSHACAPMYRGLFETAILEFEAWLANNP